MGEGREVWLLEGCGHVMQRLNDRPLAREERQGPGHGSPAAPAAGSARARRMVLGSLLWRAGHDPPSLRLIIPGTRPSVCRARSEEHTSELQSPDHLVCRLLLEKKKNQVTTRMTKA